MGVLRERFKAPPLQTAFSSVIGLSAVYRRSTALPLPIILKRSKSREKAIAYEQWQVIRSTFNLLPSQEVDLEYMKSNARN